MLGANDQTPAPWLNNEESSPLPTPPLAVRLIDGKNAARAEPILALADFRLCSACSTSGRFINTCEETPAGRSRMIPPSASMPLGSRFSGTLCPTAKSSAFFACAALVA